MLKLFRSIFGSEKGATAVEYGLIAALIVIAMMTALSNVAGSTTNMWNDVSDQITSSTE